MCHFGSWSRRSTALKVRKSSYEKLLSQLQTSRRPQEPEAEKMASAREI